MNTSTIEEISDDCVLYTKGGGDNVEHSSSPSTDRTTKKRRSLDESELSTSSSGEFEVIKEREHVSDTTGTSAKANASCSLASRLKNVDKLIQTWIASDTDKNLRKRGKNVDESISSSLLLVSNDSEVEKSADSDDKLQLHKAAEKSRNESSLKSYSALIAFSFLFIVLSSLVVPIVHFRFVRDEEATRKETAKDAIIAEQKQIIAKLNHEIENLRKLLSEKSGLLIGSVIDEERLSAFERRTGYDYRLVIVDWKKADEHNHVPHRSRQHLRLSLKQCNGSFFVYDHGPTSGKLFAVGDRIVDVDGRHFTTTIDLKDHILWASHNRDFFTTIVERPISEEANRTVADCLRPDASSFSTIISTSA